MHKHLPLALLLFCAPALAQESTPPIDPYPDDAPMLPAHPVSAPPPYQAPKAPRAGLIGGFALGLGNLAAGRDAETTLNYTVSFGGYVTHSLALLVELWGGRHDNDDFRISNHKQGLSGMYWLSDSIWGKASVGSASYTTYVDDVELASFRGLAFGIGIGWVFYSRGNFHVDARVGLNIEAYKDARDKVRSSALQLGLHYF